MLFWRMPKWKDHWQVVIVGMRTLRMMCAYASPMKNSKTFISLLHKWERHWNTPQGRRCTPLVTKCQCERPPSQEHRNLHPKGTKKTEDENRESPRCLVRLHTHTLHRDITQSLLADMLRSGDVVREGKKEQLASRSCSFA